MLHLQLSHFAAFYYTPRIPACNTQIGADDTRYKRYSALDDDGICRVGEKLNDQSIMINREVPMEDRDLLTNVSSLQGQDVGSPTEN